MRFRSSVGVATIDLSGAVKLVKSEKVTYQSIPYYPVVERDLGMVVPNVVKYKHLEKDISSYNSLIKKVQLFDVYHGLDTGTSIALRLTFSSTDRTLEAKEVDDIVEKLRISLEKKHKVTFR